MYARLGDKKEENIKKIAHITMVRNAFMYVYSLEQRMCCWAVGLVHTDCIQLRIIVCGP